MLIRLPVFSLILALFVISHQLTRAIKIPVNKQYFVVATGITILLFSLIVEHFVYEWNRLWSGAILMWALYCSIVYVLYAATKRVNIRGNLVFIISLLILTFHVVIFLTPVLRSIPNRPHCNKLLPPNLLDGKKDYMFCLLFQPIGAR